jgi:hypothetical protein
MTRTLLVGLSALLLAAGCKGEGKLGDDTGTDVTADGDISVSPASIDFGTLFVGNTDTADITVDNIGNGAVDVSLSVLGSWAGDYVVSPLTAAPDGGASSTHTVTFTPTDWGNRSVSVIVEDSISGGRVEIPITAMVQLDADGDGFGSTTSGGDDCDDDDATVNPDATDEWYDGIDSDCDGANDMDQDGDGVEVDQDCDDEDATVYPGADDAWYDGVDSDCAGDNDYDADGDGYESQADGDGDDCDDTDADINPGADFVPYDGVDEDCSGYDNDADRDGYDSEDYGGDDCDDDDADVNPGADEIWYDGEDQNCDGANDYDQDADGYDHEDYGGTDCNDEDASIVEPSAEVIDGSDNDCNGYVDDFEIDTVSDGTLYSTVEGTGLGSQSTMALGGDIDDDGTEDFVVAARGYSSAGRAWVVSGADLDATTGDIDDDATYIIDGIDTSQDLGYVIGPMQDLDGDGAAELLLGGYSNGGGYTSSGSGVQGSTWLWDGATLGATNDTDDAIADFVGVEGADMPALSAFGDLNGDGTMDIIVSDPFNNETDSSGDPIYNPGVISLFEGGGTGTLDRDDADSNVYGVEAGDKLGYSTVIADLDDDGYDDLIAGAPQESTGGDSAGAIYIFSGSSTISWSSDAETEADAQINGDTDYTYIGGRTIPVPGDVDGDGNLDLGFSQDNADSAWLFLGAGSLSGTNDVGDADHTITVSGSAFGYSMIMNSDVDGDGDDEIIIGDWAPDISGTDHGMVMRFDYDSGWSSAVDAYDATATLWGLADYDYLGTALAGGADIDGDGNEDVLIAAQGADDGANGGGVIYIITDW